MAVRGASLNRAGGEPERPSAAVRRLLRHRGEWLLAIPPEGLREELGGDAGVAALVEALYRRIERDGLLREVFPHFQSALAVPFFVQWFGGPREYADGLEGGLLRRHQHRYITAEAATAWLRCLREALVERGIATDRVLKPLTRIARSMVHSSETDRNELCKSCDAVQTPAQVELEGVLDDASRGRTARVTEALERDPTLATRRGTNQRTLAWVAVSRNRREILERVLAAGGDCVRPGCDPLETTMACDQVRLGTAVSVTPLAIARKWRPKLVGLLEAHGAIDDPFTAAWTGDVEALAEWLEQHPELVNAIDPADDFQEVSLLCHAVAGGEIDGVRLLLEQGAEVRRHSGQLLTLAVVMNRLDLVRLLLEHGADVQRAGLLGRLDDAERPIADLLIAEGMRVPDWMLPRACRPDVSRNELHRVQVLLDYGAGLDDRGRYGLTALHYAVRGGKVPLVRLLLERGADVQARDEAGLTPLWHVAKTRAKGDPRGVLELLLEAGAEIDARDEQGGTLLMHFARQGNVRMVEWLLAHGSDPLARNGRGKTAAEVGRKYAEVVRRLEGATGG